MAVAGGSVGLVLQAARFVAVQHSAQVRDLDVAQRIEMVALPAADLGAMGFAATDFVIAGSMTGLVSLAILTTPSFTIRIRITGTIPTGITLTGTDMKLIMSRFITALHGLATQ